MSNIIKEIVIELDNQVRGRESNGNLTVNQIKMIDEFVNTYNKTMGFFPFPLKRR